MELDQIEVNLRNPDYQYRLKAIAALKDYSSEVAVPILQNQLHDSEFLVRSFVAMGLGKQRTANSFAALIEMVKFDDTPNVRAEAANSLSLFGKVAAPQLVTVFFQDDHWIVRRTILAALVELECPNELFDVCVQAIQDEDTTVQESGVDALGSLANTDVHLSVLSQLLGLVGHESWRMRQRTVYALKQFQDYQAKEALSLLRQDEDYRVVGAVLEDLLPK
jgi:HEAT repeat protein